MIALHSTAKYVFCCLSLCWLLILRLAGGKWLFRTTGDKSILSAVLCTNYLPCIKLNVDHTGIPPSSINGLLAASVLSRNSARMESPTSSEIEVRGRPPAANQKKRKGEFELQGRSVSDIPRSCVRNVSEASDTVSPLQKRLSGLIELLKPLPVRCFATSTYHVLINCRRSIPGVEINYPGSFCSPCALWQLQKLRPKSKPTWEYPTSCSGPYYLVDIIFSFFDVRNAVHLVKPCTKSNNGFTIKRLLEFWISKTKFKSREFWMTWVKRLRNFRYVLNVI